MIMPDWWVDGHFISAWTAEEALAEVRRLFDGYEPQEARPWTKEDQAELERVQDS